jgi:hypothetical protein
MKHVYVRFEPNLKPVVLLRDDLDSSLGDCKYLGVQELSKEIMIAPEYSVDGIVLNTIAYNNFLESDLEHNKQKLKDAILNYGYFLINEGIEFEGNIYQIDENSLVRMNLFKSSTTQWRTLDNRFISMTPEKMFTLFDISLSKAKIIFDKSRELIDSLENMQLSEIKNFDVKSAWES